MFECQIVSLVCQLLSGSRVSENTLSVALSCSAQDRDSQEVLLKSVCVHMIVCHHVSGLSIQSNGITAVVGPHTIPTVLHTHTHSHSLLACELSLCVCAGDQDGEGRSEDCQRGFGG